MKDRITDNKYIKKLTDYIKRIIEVTRRNEMRILPGNLAFFIILSIAPLLTLVGLIGAQFSEPLESIVNFLSNTLPKDVINLLSPVINNVVSSPTNMLFYLIIGFITASNGAHSVIIASNTLYDVKSNSVIFRRVKAFLLTILLIILFTFILFILAFGNTIYQALIDLKILSLNIPLYVIIKFVKWPIAFFIVYICVKILYTTSIDKRIASKYMTKGAIFTTIGWILVTAIYSYYANNIANYGVFYGSLSNLIVLMIWIYILSYILVIGIAINSSIYENLVKDGIIKEK